MLKVRESLTHRRNRCGLNGQEHDECINEVIALLHLSNRAGKLEDNLRKICALSHRKLYRQRANSLRRLRSRLKIILRDETLITPWLTSALLDDLKSCVESLPSKRLSILQLHLAGLKWREVATTLGEPLDTIYGDYVRALKCLRKCLCGKGWDEEFK